MYWKSKSNQTSNIYQEESQLPRGGPTQVTVGHGGLGCWVPRASLTHQGTTVLGSGLKMRMGLLWTFRPKDAFCSHLCMALRTWGDEPRKSQSHGPISKLSGTAHTFLAALSPVSTLTMSVSQDVAQLPGPFPIVSLALALPSCMLSIFLI